MTSWTSSPTLQDSACQSDMLLIWTPACRVDLLLLIYTKFNWPHVFILRPSPTCALGDLILSLCHTFKELGPWPRVSLLPQRDTVSWETTIRQRQLFQISVISTHWINASKSKEAAHKTVQEDQLIVRKRPFVNLQRMKPGKAACILAVLTAVPHFQLQLVLGSAPGQDPDRKMR